MGEEIAFPGAPLHGKAAAVEVALEAEYNQRARVPEHPAIFARWEAASAALRAQARCGVGLSYGDHPRQAVDVLHAPDAAATLVFIHGGYWRSLAKSMFSFVAAPFLARGVSVALVGYRLCPEVPLDAVVDDCTAALEWLHSNAGRLELPMHRHALAGHSAGGHLAAMMLTRESPALHLGLSAVVSLSGLFELTPLLACSMNQDLRMDRSMAERLSPVRLRSCHGIPMHLEAGSEETAAFRAQSALLVNAWPANHIGVSEAAGANHFTIVDAFASGCSAAARFVLSQLLHR